MPVDPKVLDRISKMMAKESSLRQIGTEATLAEAANAASLIAEMLLKHKIDMTEVERKAIEDNDPIAREVYQYSGEETYRALKRQAWEIALASTVARAHDCRCLVGNGYFAFVGRSDDRAVTMMMFRILRKELTEGCTWGYRVARKNGQNTKGFISTFFTAANRVIRERYEAMKSGVIEANMAQALVLRTDADLDTFVRQWGAGADTTKQRGTYNQAGYTAGTQFGNTVGLNRGSLEG